MEYLCYLTNVSLVLRVIEYLQGKPQLRVNYVTVINQVDGWVVRIRLKYQVSPQEDGNLRSVLSELGNSYSPPLEVRLALWSLAGGQPALDVMHRYQVAIVSHGRPEKEEIEEFRKLCIQGLGYCPHTLV